MSVSYWMIEGIGINVDNVLPHVDDIKLKNFLVRQLPNDERLTTIDGDVDIWDFVEGSPFDSVGDLLTHLDDTNTLTWGDNGYDACFFYYPPSMPWHHVENEPKTPEEVHRRIIAAIKEITTLTDKEIDNMIDDNLYVVGVG